METIGSNDSTVVASRTLSSYIMKAVLSQLAVWGVPSQARGSRPRV